jgi:hypothetical protein
MFATVRNRRGVIAGVEPFDGDAGRLHLVHVEYKDDQHPVDERLLWELEASGRLIEATALPEAGNSDPMPTADFDALVRAARWSALSAFLDPDGAGPLDRFRPDNPDFAPIELTADDDATVRVVAELVEVLG